jgi:hypothetical protein
MLLWHCRRTLPPDSAGAVDAVPDGITLTELSAQLPLSRASMFELIKMLAIITTKGPGPGGRGRVAWLSSADALRVSEAAEAVHRGEVRIADLAQGRQSQATLQTVPAASVAASAESGDYADAGSFLERLQALQLAQTTGAVIPTREARWILGRKPVSSERLERMGLNSWQLLKER